MWDNWTEDMKVIVLALVIIGSCILLPFTIIIWMAIGLLVWWRLRQGKAEITRVERCPKCKGKMKRYVGVDHAARGSMAAAADRCVKCGLVRVVELKELKPIRVGTMNRGVKTGCRYCLQGSSGKVMEGYMLKHRGGYYAEWCEGCPYPRLNGVIYAPYEDGLDKATLERL